MGRVSKGQALFNKHFQENGTASLWPIFESQVKRLPDEETCIWSRNGVYTWRQTHAQAVRYGKWFLSLGVKPGDLVALYMMNSPEFVFASLGLWAIGAVPSWLNANMGGDALVHCVRLSEAKIMLVDEDEVVRGRMEEMRSKLEEGGVNILICDAQFDDLLAKATAQMPGDIPAELRKDVTAMDPMSLIYTSGSTGMPKACPFRLNNVWAIADWRAWLMESKAGPNGDRWYVCMPLYHGTGGTSMMTCLLTGTTLCIGRKFSVSKFWDDVRDSDSTIIVYVGETARYLVAAPKSDRDRDHKVWAMFGNGMRPDVWSRFRDRFGIKRVLEFFNSTEGILGFMNPCDGKSMLCLPLRSSY
jgi:acyl-CoA synthetase (AMP-forming)/AMP-acid ligase II